MVKFMIVGIRRTGTTLIRTTLDSHPKIRCYGASFRFGARIAEGYGENYESGYQHWLSQSAVRKVRDLVAPGGSVKEYLDQHLEQPGCDAAGFKLLAHDFRQFPAIMSYLRAENARVIQVVRKNVLKTLISRHVKKVRRFGRSTKEVARTQIELRADRLLRDLERLELDNEAWMPLVEGMPYLRTTYEDFVANKDGELRRLLEFLDVAYVEDLDSPLVKVNPDDIRQIVTNYDAVEAALKGTKFEWCLGKS